MHRIVCGSRWARAWRSPPRRQRRHVSSRRTPHAGTVYDGVLDAPRCRRGHRARRHRRLRRQRSRGRAADRRDRGARIAELPLATLDGLTSGDIDNRHAQLQIADVIATFGRARPFDGTASSTIILFSYSATAPSPRRTSATSSARRWRWSERPRSSPSPTRPGRSPGAPVRRRRDHRSPDCSRHRHGTMGVVFVTNDAAPPPRSTTSAWRAPACRSSHRDRPRRAAGVDTRSSTPEGDRERRHALADRAQGAEQVPRRGLKAASNEQPFTNPTTKAPPT